MLKKLSVTLLLITPLTCFAMWGQPGPYLGAGIGIDAVDFEQTAFVTRTGASLQEGAFQVKNDTENAAQGLMGTLFAGYALTHGMFYLAGEVNGDLSNAKFESSNQNFTANTNAGLTYKINRSWGASALPGIYLPWCSLLYGRVGYEGGSFHINSSDVSIPSVDKTLNGLRLGLGLEKQVSKNLSLRLEYSHVQYQGLTRTYVDNSDAAEGHVFTKKTSIDPYVNQFVLGVVYRFC